MVDAALINGLLLNLVPLIKDEVSLLWSFKKEVQKLLSTLSSINIALETAERKNLLEKDKQTEDWLQKLKDVAYEVRDIMDECTFEDLRLQVKRRDASSSTRMQVTNLITHPFNNTWTRLKIGHKIKDVQDKLDQIYSDRKQFQLPETIHDSKSKTSWRETISISTYSQVYGRDKEKKEIVDVLVNTSNTVDVTKLSVLPIVGIGGLGKTTIAQMIFNDENVAKIFDTKIWVCVSEKFDIKLVIEAITEEKTEASLEELQKKVRIQLRGKKFLIVLDDVWNEDEEEWNKLRSILDCGSHGAFILTTTRKRKVAEIMETIQHFKLSSLSKDDCWLLFEERAFKHGTPKPQNLIDIGNEIAAKCKGVPLVAKTLGSQLRFNSDENEWCRIRDSKIWEISQNEESILPILRLSYYDLPNDLRRCFAYCAIFPKDTVIQKERLIHMWMAHGLISTIDNQEAEDTGSTIWNELCWRSFFQDEIVALYWYGVRTTCMMHDLMHDLAQSIMKDECYIVDSTSSSDGFGRKSRHLTIIKELHKTTLLSLKIGCLQSIILLHPTNYGYVSKDILSVLKKLPSLRVFEVSCDVEYLDLRHLGCLKHLRYLNLSSIKVKTLPNSICDLLNLQTLKLNDCLYLESLPKNTKDLVNLRHLYLEGCRRLKYMPQGMAKLKHLKTLSLFVISTKKDHSQLDDLKVLDIRGYLEIRNLERVSSESIARGRISFAAKNSNINNLELRWAENDDNNNENSHEEIGEALEVPSTRLKKLKMLGYKGVNLPKWVGDSYASLTRFELYRLENVVHIITINNVNTSASSDENGMVVLLPLLERLIIYDMKNLTDLVSPPIPITTTGAFPNLSKIVINNCPNLGSFPSHLKSLKHLTIGGECSNELLYSLSNLNGLTHLHLYGLDGRSVLFPAAYKSVMFDYEIQSSTLEDNNNEGQREWSTLQSLLDLYINRCNDLRCLFDDGMIIQLPSLQTLEILECEKLWSLSQKHHGQGSGGERTRGVTNLNSLTELYIKDCPELMISNEEFGSLNINSLEKLYIRDCPKLVSPEEAEAVMEFLHSLQTRLGHNNFEVDILLESEEKKQNIVAI